MVNSSGESRHLCLISDDRENLTSVSPLSIIVSCGFLIHGLYYVEKIPLYSVLILLHVFIMKRCWSFVKYFFLSIEFH